MIVEMYGTLDVEVVVDEVAAEMVEEMHMMFVTAAELVDMAAADYNYAAGNSSNIVHNCGANMNRAFARAVAAMDVRELLKMHWRQAS